MSRRFHWSSQEGNRSQGQSRRCDRGALSCRNSTVLVDVLETSSFSQQVNRWWRNLDHQITALRADLDTINAKEVGGVTTPILEAESLAIVLILYD
jgi:hypothetical protein